MLDGDQRELLGAIWRRTRFLSKRIRDYGSDANSYDLSERAALHWLMDRAGVPYPPGEG